jgi:hypothetical protein
MVLSFLLERSVLGLSGYPSFLDWHLSWLSALPSILLGWNPFLLGFHFFIGYYVIFHSL